MLLTKGRKSSASKFDKKEFDTMCLTDAVNLLSYGCQVQKYNKSNGKPIQRMYYICEDDIDYLQYIDQSKPYPHCRICLLDIIELREIPTSEVFQNLPSSKVLQITFSTKKHVLMFTNSETRDLFWQGLQYFIEIAEQSLHLGFSQVGRIAFLNNDQDQNQQLSINEIKTLIEDLQLSVADKDLQTLFDKFDKNQSGCIDFSEFQLLLKHLMNYDIFKPLFLKYVQTSDANFDNDQGCMSRQEFLNFLSIEQKQVHDQAFKLYATMNSDRQFMMSFQQFVNYLLSQNNSMFEYKKQYIYQSEQHPLTDYWINSSHNTYLVDNQLTGDSSVQAYIDAFQKGCRCVEIDCWDGPNNTPLVYHGYTMTSKITFESVIRTISEYAFKYSKYPIVLSLEVHCSITQQDTMANIINHYLSEYLLLLPDDYATTLNYPTLSQLNYKILIKHRGKLKSSVVYRGNQQGTLLANPNEYCDVVSTTQFQSENLNRRKVLNRQDNGLLAQRMIQVEQFQIDDEAYPMKRVHPSGIEPTLRPKYKLQRMGTSYATATPNPRIFESNTPMKNESDDDITPDKPKKKTQESIKMSMITALFGCNINAKQRTVWEISSLEENKVNDKLLQFHRKYFTRIYPAGSRVDSSNYDPIPAFSCGSQIVALNFQTNDLPMLLNVCKFAENGGIESGYVLKPAWMRADGKRQITDFKTPIMKFDITFLVGYNLRPLEKRKNEIVNPQIKVSVRGIPIDELNNTTMSSKVVKNNGFNPRFDFKYEVTLYCPDLAFLVIEVSDNAKAFLGWTAIPISCICYGYRSIQLLNQYLKPQPNCCLLAYIE